MATEEHKHITKVKLKLIPKRSGVYLMRDDSGVVIYIGKAKELRARVRSYFSGGDGRLQIPALLERVVEVETLVTENERQAIILESDLIKKYKPRYNVRLKDDKAHLIVRIDKNHEWPRLELVRKIEDDGATYVGPFAFGYEVRALIEIIKRSMPLRTCSDKVLYNRVRPCLEYQIKRCPAPCCFEIDKEDYTNRVEQAISLLKGKNQSVVSDLEKEIQIASDAQRYEDAAAIRDRLEVLKKAGEEKLTQDFSVQAQDAFGIYRVDTNVSVSVLMVRQGRLFGAKSFSFEGVELPEEELLPSILTQFYQGSVNIPEEIFTPFKLEDTDAREELYQEIFGARPQICVPKRGPKARLLQLAMENASENFQTSFSSDDTAGAELQQLFEELELEEVPRTLECVDISHFQGGDTVGAVVHFRDGVPDKNSYRRFILSVEQNDDFASMREVLRRHLSRGAEENTLPDLLVIDGGPGQLSLALAVRKELGLLKPELIGLAKKRTKKAPHYSSQATKVIAYKPERVYREDSETPIILNPTSSSLHLLERIRNEAHRFAITFHRARRNKRTFESELEKIPGVGKTRRLTLLKEFKTVKAIREASVEELVERAGIPQSLARKIIGILDKS